MAVILVAGNSPVMPSSLMDSVRPLTTNIALEMGYAFGFRIIPMVFLLIIQLLVI